MSIYDNTDKPAYQEFDAPISYCKNVYINSWWTKEHDNLIATQIIIDQWNWPWSITDQIVAITSKEIIENWKVKDPLCKEYAWYNILMYFAIARAKQIGLNQKIRKPEWKECALCKKNFIENSVPFPLIKRMGIENIEFCSPCLTDSILSEGNNKMKKSDILSYLKELTRIINKVPSQSYVQELPFDLNQIDYKIKYDLLKILQKKPSIKRVKSLLGSWLNALIQAKVLEDGTRKTSRGIQCIAKDGHICYSLGEKTIDDLLFENSIDHTKEPKYPVGHFRGDFGIGTFIVEYFGLIGNDEYDKKVEMKRGIAIKHNLNLIEIYPEDLVNTEQLRAKILDIIDTNELNINIIK